ncbi:nitronate monooxygenase family protein [Bacteroides helcogenes]|uniref:2-nitropropane dioxygenase NPD n=1 Tax=Bacteroides helcogenes (strain ATCC 35417 / DSM 20613 / JCM 6297 / CCUG 15421 / P 36-108) TaxID=693979 RepID=E6SQA9_BACT6|nr:nitronate monooxygenase [Bacteroides helcogenes]ADV43968.1 2-nitropropane dioxygenase NPD [Bacteroides helcogenes P 36-108]MDY5236894.1 nitronate monooxygenase [Bacteroides helcogenes]
MNRVTSLFGIRYPIIQGGMVWCSGWRLASAVSNAGGLGLLGAGSMHPDTLREHIRKCREATHHAFGVNIPLMYPQIEEIMQIVADEGVKIVFTSAGSPKKWTGWLHDRGIIVAHVVSSSHFAGKAEEAGVDAVVAEGFEAGGHNGREETTTLCLVPAVRAVTALPLIAAGGIATGEAMLAVHALGAEGVQVGTRFALTAESSASNAFKDYCLHLEEGDTRLLLKKVSPVRLVRNGFRDAVEAAEATGANEEELRVLLGRGRAKLGIFEGDIEQGELEIGQVSALLCGKGIQSVSAVMQELVEEYGRARERFSVCGDNW